MTTVVVTRRFLADYARNPVNLLLLVVVPVVFVAVAAGRLADLARLLGGAGVASSVGWATAGWAAGFLAGIAMYFQVAAARDADRRMVLAGLPARRLVGARLAVGLGLAVLASTAALVTLQSPMLHGEPAGWAHDLPAYGGYRLLIDATLTRDFDQTRAVLVALAWLAALALAATVLIRRSIRPRLS